MNFRKFVSFRAVSLREQNGSLEGHFNIVSDNEELVPFDLIEGFEFRQVIVGKETRDVVEILVGCAFYDVFANKQQVLNMISFVNDMENAAMEDGPFKIVI